MTKWSLLILQSVLTGALAGCGGPEPELDVESAASSLRSGFEVDFGDCTEMAGIGFVPAAAARARVPADIALAGDATSAIVVVRIANCEALSIDGHPRAGHTVAQIGLTMAAGDPTSDINNYTLWYDTDSPALAARLRAAGVDTRLVPRLEYEVEDGELSVRQPRSPRYRADGPVVMPTASPVPFVASWWQRRGARTVQMRTALPAIAFSGAQMTVTTPAGSELAQLIGGTSLGFAILDSYNAFDAAHMEVSVD
jgi:hypothetical protein